MGRASHAGRGRRGLFHPAKPAAEDFLSAQHARRRCAAACRKPGRGSAGLLVLMALLTRSQRGTEVTKGARARSLWFALVVYFVTFVSSVPAARNGVIRGRVEVRRVMPQVERR